MTGKMACAALNRRPGDLGCRGKYGLVEYPATF